MGDILNTPEVGLDQAIRVGKEYFRQLRQERDTLRQQLAAATEELRRRHARPLPGQSLGDAIRTALENADTHIAAAVERANVLESLIFGAHDKAFADQNYEYVDPQTAIDLLIADLKTARIERAAAVERAEKAEKREAEEEQVYDNYMAMLTNALGKRPYSLPDGIDAIRARAEAAEATGAGLRAAGQAVIDRWDSPHWKDMPPTSDCMNGLRAALAATPAQHAARLRERVLLALADDDTLTECTGTRAGHKAIQEALRKLADEAEKEAGNG